MKNLPIDPTLLAWIVINRARKGARLRAASGDQAAEPVTPQPVKALCGAAAAKRRKVLGWIAMAFSVGAWADFGDVNAESSVVAGVRVGYRFTLQKCQSAPRGMDCVRDALPFGNGYVKASVQIASSPVVMSGPYLTVWVMPDGIIGGVEVPTHGIATQSVDLQTLVQRYGTPTSSETRRVGNLAGAQFDALSVSWSLPGKTVHFDGATTRFDQGQVRVFAPGTDAMRSAWSAYVETLLNPRKL